VLDAGTGVSLVHDLNRSKLLIREMEILPQPLPYVSFFSGDLERGVTAQAKTN
jgi:hypothetical protein